MRGSGRLVRAIPIAKPITCGYKSADKRESTSMSTRCFKAALARIGYDGLFVPCVITQLAPLPVRVSGVCTLLSSRSTGKGNPVDPTYGAIHSGIFIFCVDFVFLFENNIHRTPLESTGHKLLKLIAHLYLMIFTGLLSTSYAGILL